MNAWMAAAIFIGIVVALLLPAAYVRWVRS